MYSTVIITATASFHRRRAQRRDEHSVLQKRRGDTGRPTVEAHTQPLQHNLTPAPHHALVQAVRGGPCPYYFPRQILLGPGRARSDQPYPTIDRIIVRKVASILALVVRICTAVQQCIGSTFHNLHGRVVKSLFSYITCPPWGYPSRPRHQTPRIPCPSRRQEPLDSGLRRSAPRVHRHHQHGQSRPLDRPRLLH